MVAGSNPARHTKEHSSTDQGYPFRRVALFCAPFPTDEFHRAAAAVTDIAFAKQTTDLLSVPPRPRQISDKVDNSDTRKCNIRCATDSS